MQHRSTRYRKLLEQESATQSKSGSLIRWEVLVGVKTGARGSKKDGSEEAASPGFFNTLKKMLEFKTSSREVKPGGTGVTGAASTPPDSTRYVGKLRENGKEKATHTADMATDTSRKPKEKPPLGDQNEHLTHKKEGNEDSGKGSAAEEPVLPSQ